MRLLPTVLAALAGLAIGVSPVAAQTGAAPAAVESAPGQAPAAPAAAPPATTQADIICRRTQVTGSLVQWTKACHTRSQWANIDGQHNRLARQMVDDGTTRPAGN